MIVDIMIVDERNTELAEEQDMYFLLDIDH
jgi:hypothetical protein